MGFPDVPQSRSLCLVDQIGTTLVVAYKESTIQLEQALNAEGFTYQILRQVDQPEYAEYASSYRCLLNHSCAWAIAAHASQPSLIVEADFVPVKGFAQLPLPFRPHQSNTGMAWLYTCAAQVYSVSSDGFAEGFSTGMVAYVVTPQAAQALLGLVDHVTQKYGTGYATFDSEVDRFLRSCQLKNYIGFRNYGEHGGSPNPEHRRHGMSGIHRADVLYGGLAFVPAYATSTSSSGVYFAWARLNARLRGVGRLLAGRFLRFKVLRNSS
ncbi:MAG: LPS biosynthesis glycosyltransferase, partial [Leptolyngbyaceae cyanobacterium SL_7_1]|nr:LPS biosynthesis glycosyltransferase [Leptolyngbyaceae cyanobacterium SL_7_1]